MAGAGGAGGGGGAAGWANGRQTNQVTLASEEDDTDLRIYKANPMAAAVQPNHMRQLALHQEWLLEKPYSI